MCIPFVEDDPLIRRLGCEWLELRGYEVVYAANAKSAIAIIENPPLPLTALICDLNLGPGPDGSTVGECMSRLHPHVPIIIVAAWPYHFVARGFGEMDWTLISKPYLPSDLVKHLHSRLS